MHYASHVTCLSCHAFLRKASHELAQFPRLQCSQRRHHSCHKESQDVVVRGVAMRRWDREIWRFDFFFKRLHSILWDSETGSAPYSRSTVSLPSKSVPVDRGSGYRVWSPGWCTRNPYVSIHFLLCILPVAVHHHYPGTRIRLGNETGRLKEWMMSKSKKTQGGCKNFCNGKIVLRQGSNASKLLPVVLWQGFMEAFCKLVGSEAKVRCFFRKYPWFVCVCVWPFQQLQGLVAKLL